MPSLPRIILLKRWLNSIRGERVSATSQKKVEKPEVKPELNEISEIIDNGLYLSGCGAITRDALSSLGITAVVRAITEEEEKAVIRSTGGAVGLPDPMRRMVIRLADSETADLQSHFDSVARFIHSELQSGGKVLVHCGAGVSRSSTLVIAYLMKYDQRSLRQAYGLVRNKRKIIRPNNGFFRQLIEYERCSRKDGRATVRMVLAPSGYPVPDIVFEDAIMAKLR